MKPQVKKLIEKKDFNALNQLLINKPDLANKGITIPFDFFCKAEAHPLHRICDVVNAGKITDEEAVRLARIFLDNGADIDGDKLNGQGTPLLAAASLHAELLGIFYIGNGADVHYTYKNNGASALHWAAFCGRDKLVEELINAKAVIDEPDAAYQSTPIGWAIHSLISNDPSNRHNQMNCIKELISHGANIKKLDEEKTDYLYSLAEQDPELLNLLSEIK